MILSAGACGCPSLKQKKKSSCCPPPDPCGSPERDSFSSFSSSQESSSICGSSGTVCSCEKEDPCTCNKETKDKSLNKAVVSEIEQKGQPWKEIETIFNNSRVVVRLQTEEPKPQFDPPCDCIEPEPTESQEVHNTRSDIVFQKVGCKTISVYPHPDQKSEAGARKDEAAFPTVNIEENPNIYVLRIKRKCEKSNLNLEFRSPRPWNKATKCGEKK